MELQANFWISWRVLFQNWNHFVGTYELKSATKTLRIGVPQGSTLGPLLFVLYVNDMCNCSSILEITQFDDDTTLTASGPHQDILT